MTKNRYPIAVDVECLLPEQKTSSYPPPYAAQMLKRKKTVLGDLFGLKNFGINQTRLLPGGVSALRHGHATQDEFIYILSGQPTLVTDAGETILKAGMCAGFRAGDGNAHHLLNRSDEDVLYLEIGDRSRGDRAHYPDDDLHAVLKEDGWHFLHKDGQPY